jgi:hypothetical protein
MYDDQSEDVVSEALDDAVAVAVEEPDLDVVAAPTEWTGPRCEKCDAAIKSDIVTICRNCGWYASLGRFVEVDPNWETDDDGSESAAQAPQKSHVRVWLDLLPRWSWWIIASVAVVVVESAAVRLLTPSDSPLRTTWSLAQLAAGFLAFACCHIFNFLVLAAEDADVGVMDLLLRPLKLWLRAFENLPTRLWVANTAACGVTAVAMSLLVIGGLPYERLWDWGFQAPVKQELMGAVMDRVRKLESRNGADNLEDAIGDFAGTADDLAEGSKAPPAPPRHKADCVILGYQTDRDGKLDSLVLGTNYLGRLVFAGRVRPEMSAGEMADLLVLLSRIRTHQPLISIESDSAIWVKPKYACRVSYVDRQKGRLNQIKWDRLLGTIGAKKGE